MTIKNLSLLLVLLIFKLSSPNTYLDTIKINFTKQKETISQGLNKIKERIHSPNSNKNSYERYNTYLNISIIISLLILGVMAIQDTFTRKKIYIEYWVESKFRRYDGSSYKISSPRSRILF